MVGRLTLVSLTTFVAIQFPLARAQEGIPVEVTAKAEIRQEYTTSNGTTAVRFVPANAVNQGEVVFFTLRIRNVTPVVAPEVAVTWPIPKNTVYEAKSASGPATEITFSADGGVTFGAADEVRKVDAAGVARVARPEEYTHIRWRLRYPLAAGAVAIVRFRAVFR